MAKGDAKQEVPVALGIALSFLGEVGEFKSEFWTGPCGDMHCPIFAGERWAKGKCVLEGCPRNLVHDLL